MFAVPIKAVSGQGAVGAPRRLFGDGYFFRQFGARDYDIAPDGRFLMVKERTTAVAGRQLNVVRNWAETLTERVPIN